MDIGRPERVIEVAPPIEFPVETEPETLPAEPAEPVEVEPATDREAKT